MDRVLNWVSGQNKSLMITRDGNDGQRVGEAHGMKPVHREQQAFGEEPKKTTESHHQIQVVPEPGAQPVECSVLLRTREQIEPLLDRGSRCQLGRGIQERRLEAKRCRDPFRVLRPLRGGWRRKQHSARNDRRGRRVRGRDRDHGEKPVVHRAPDDIAFAGQVCGPRRARQAAQLAVGEKGVGDRHRAGTVKPHDAHMQAIVVAIDRGGRANHQFGRGQ